MLTTILAAAVVLGVLIFVHELGHFWAAKSVDVEVPRFSIGFGPKVVGFRRGETEYVLSALPLGGYVKMAGMSEDEAFEKIEGEGDPDREPGPRDFDAKPGWARGLILSAGVGMNFLFAVVAFAAVALAWGVPASQPAVIGSVQEELLPAQPGVVELARLPSGTRIRSVGGERVESWEDVTMAMAGAPSGPVTLELADGRTIRLGLPSENEARRNLLTAMAPRQRLDPVLGEIVEGRAADRAGLRSGDRVLEVEGRPVESWDGFSEAVESRPSRPTTITVDRDGSRRQLTVTPEEELLAVGGDSLRYGRVGVGPHQATVAAAIGAADRRVGPVAALGYGFGQTWTWTVRIVEVIGDLITGQAAAENLAGPVRIAEMSGSVARAGLRSLLGFMAILSVNLAILNLLPIPILDGGQLLLLGIEEVRGRRLSVETRVRWAQIGLLLVGALMVWAIGNDLLQIFG